jgi:hypothetical protein
MRSALADVFNWWNPLSNAESCQGSVSARKQPVYLFLRSQCNSISKKMIAMAGRYQSAGEQVRLPGKEAGNPCLSHAGSIRSVPGLNKRAWSKHGQHGAGHYVKQGLSRGA